MSYSTIESAAVAVLKTHADYDDTNCRAGDVSPIKEGYERVARFLYGGVREEPVTINLLRHVWTVFIDLYVPYRGQVPEFEGRLATERQKILDTFPLYPLLNATAGVTWARITNGANPEPLNPKKGAYRGQRLLLEVAEITKPARVE